MIGRIHSIETGGTVDGPGIRYVIFFQGCPLRCLYCHNPDTRDPAQGKETSVEELLEDIKKYKSYFKFSGGGVTVSGGEPLLQPKFLIELLKALKNEGIHTAVDTSGYANLEAVKEVFDYTDLVLLDIKSINPDTFKKVASVDIEPTLNLAKYLAEKNIKMWIRYVVVPGLTDSILDAQKLADYLASFKNIEKVEILPFHKMGEYKWEALGYDYTLKGTLPPDETLIKDIKDLFNKKGS